MRPQDVQGPRSPQAVSSVAGHPRHSCPWSAHTSRALGPCLACFCSLASLFLTSALRPVRARCGAIREATPLPAPPLCSRSLAQPCPLCARSPSSSLAPFPGHCLPVSVFPLPPRRTRCGAIRVASLSLPLHLSAPWCPGPWASGNVALHPPVAFSPLRPPTPPSPPCPLPPLTLCRTPCRQVARMSSRRHTWPLSSAPSGWLHHAAARCCHSPRRCRRRGQRLQMPRGARPW